MDEVRLALTIYLRMEGYPHIKSLHSSSGSGDDMLPGGSLNQVGILKQFLCYELAQVVQVSLGLVFSKQDFKVVIARCYIVI